jgi:hypothetical protein
VVQTGSPMACQDATMLRGSSRDGDLFALFETPAGARHWKGRTVREGAAHPYTT